MKRIAIFLVPVLIVAVAAYFYFSPREFSFLGESPAYHAVPLDAPLFFEISSTRSIPLANAMFQEIKDANLWQSFFSLNEKFDFLITKSAEVPSGLRTDKLLIAIKYEGRNEITPLFIIPYSGSSKKRGWNALIEAWFPIAEFSRNERNYDHFSVIDIANNQSRNIFSYAYAEGLLLASPKSVLIEQALRQLNSSGISGNPGFVKVNRSASKQAQAAIYINHRFFPGFLARWLNNDVFRRVNEFGETEVIRYARDINVFREYADWSELDIQFHDNGLKMSGITSAYDSSNHFLSIFSNQQPQRFQADKLLPDNTSFFVSYNFSDSHDFFRRLENYFRANHRFYYREEKFTRMASESRTNVKNLFQNILESEIILAYTSLPDPTGKSGLVIIPTRNRTAAEGQILQMLRIRAERSGQILNDQSVTIDSDKRWYAYKFPYPSLPGLWLGKPFHSIRANYIAFWENNIVMANSENEMASYFRKMDQGEVLSKYIGYQRFMRSADGRASVNVFFDVARGYNIGSEILDASLFKMVSGKQEQLQKFRYANWQISNSKEMFVNKFIFLFNPDGS
jgi:hypothetical protein